VDDNDVNLRVATGLLSLYEITPVTALSGREALRLVQENEYDIVFMDHMMPEMDGVETTAKIRGLGGKYKDLIIIALTANAIHGAKEMFLSSGFNGFLSKPIITNALYEVLMEWLPADKIIEKAGGESAVPQDNPTGFLDALKKIPEINTEAGLRNFTGVTAMYRETFELFYQKITKECAGMTVLLNANDTDGFSILIHGMKSSLAIVGAVELSDAAAKMEDAAIQGDVGYCLEQYPPFKGIMLKLHERLNSVFGEAKSATDKPQGDIAYLREGVQKALEAANDFDSEACMEIINALLAYDFGEQANKLLDGALSALGSFDIGETTGILKKIP
jgi:CheY-like chemotaxis protein